jgi:hypothetical protein
MAAVGGPKRESRWLHEALYRSALPLVWIDDFDRLDMGGENSMRAQTSVTGIGTSSIIALETRFVPFLVSATVYLGSGCTASVEYTVDNIQSNNYNPATGYWVPAADGTDVTGVAGFTVAFTAPVLAVRLNQSAGSALSILTVIQGAS